jgi:hypothetical protein
VTGKVLKLDRDCATCRRRKRKSERLGRRREARDGHGDDEHDGAEDCVEEKGQRESDESGVFADDEEEKEMGEEGRGCGWCDAVIDERPGQ